MSPAATQRPAIAPAPRAASPLSGAKPIGRGGLEILEEATHLLRTAPFSIVAAHAIGTIPFVLALLYYWSDMASGAFAMKHVTEASAG
ncbi:MAG: hypothetical protein JO317_03325, partial [Verrucomicrobiae bacterium]|nr:hypothetical protein [Verrucomicrobiae bacterium]